MLFENPKLKSFFELEYILDENDMNLNRLSEELYRITNILYDFYMQKEVICFHHKANNDTSVFVDFNNISDKTWFRTTSEIKELLYRPKINNHFQHQFSINKALADFGIIEPNDKENYKKYLQLLYLFYIVNYFAFPKRNIFKLLKREYMSYLTTYDEGVEQGIYLSFIIANLLTDTQLEKFIFKMNDMSEILNYISMQISIQDYDDYEQIYYDFEKKIMQCSMKVKSKMDQDEDIVEKLIDYFQNYSMNSYSLDLLFNLTKETNLFKYEKLKIEPMNSWKQKYISLEKLNDFLYSDELIMFCKQSIHKIEYRNKVKFNNSNAVKFLKKLIEYDKEWIDDFNENEAGLLLEIKNNQICIYALKVAIIIMTYNNLVNKLKTKIATRNNKYFQSLQSVLSIRSNLDNLYPSTLGIRFFMLAVHAQYLNVTGKDYYSIFVNQFLFPEILNMKVFCSAYAYNGYQETKQFLYEFSKVLEI